MQAKARSRKSEAEANGAVVRSLAARLMRLLELSLAAAAVLTSAMLIWPRASPYPWSLATFAFCRVIAGLLTAVSRLARFILTPEQSDRPRKL
ncbi:MAG: hypothetical protein AVDCRST_MAG62-747 [uncultured Sphingomonas sp.]|uniref:Uncharacterized protein n=1 Tax=uncultured Sphingomonas sp. TaxID=158754 RepID=A0A6J4T6C7_9SPHN|nr:MAG: hypothetical protein AVDCRST_MAG62-747 [uncultured Sphingomonas sp.]